MGKFNIKIFSDGANVKDMLEATGVDGFTTNPTLMKKAGVQDYEQFAKEVLGKITDRPVSFEVFADEFDEMERQAMKISSWGRNVYVKVPITNSKGESSIPLIRKLSKNNVKVNVTAILTLEQVKEVAGALDPYVPSIVSVFAGRIADTGVDPANIMKTAKGLLKNLPKAELLWASTREAINIRQAEECGTHIITVTPDILRKAIEQDGKDLGELSLETVRMFKRDADTVGYRID